MPIGSLAFWLRPFLAAEQAVAITINPCAIGDLSCNADLPSYLGGSLIPGLLTAFGGILFAALVFYGLRLAAESRNDSAMGEAITAYGQAFAGATVVLGSYVLAQAFGTVGSITPTEVETGIIAGVVSYIMQIVGAVLILNIVIQSFRMMTSQDEGGISGARNNLIYSFMGAAIVMLGAAILDMVRPGAFNHGINQHIVGIANFLGVFFGLLAVVAVIVAGIMLVVSVDESLKDRARSMIIAALVAIVVVMVSLGLIQILLPT